MPILLQEEWNKHVTMNQDPYGKYCVNVARKVMEFLDAEPDRPIQLGYEDEFSIHKLICRADKATGIIDFMAGCVAQMVGQVHSRGDEFRKVWNENRGVKEDKENNTNASANAG